MGEGSLQVEEFALEELLRPDEDEAVRHAPD